MRIRRVMTWFAAVAGLAACRAAPTTPPSPPRQSASGVRVVHASTGRNLWLNELAPIAAKADIVFFGEQHDDPETHYAEFALLEGIGRVRSSVIVSLEMFERDVQPMLDEYLSGRMSEADFLAKSRPWERYATDYRGLVQLARARGWLVIASNVPRPIASAVSRKGLSALDTLPPASRAWVARDIECPKDAYYDRFAESMRGHGGPGTATDSAAARAMTQRFYEAQCVKDETMAESIAGWVATGAIVVHFNGAFHSDFGLGTASRVKRRVPMAKTLLITAIPVDDIGAIDSLGDVRRADYLIFTKKKK